MPCSGLIRAADDGGERKILEGKLKMLLSGGHRKNVGRSRSRASVCWEGWPS